MEPLNELLNHLPTTPIGWILFGISLLPLIGRAYMALKNEGGAKGVWKSVILGKTITKE